KCPSFCTTEKVLNESVQALMRGVPWTAIGGERACGTCPPNSGGDCPAAKLAQCVWTKPENIAADAKLYHFDKFLHFWPAYDSPFNLNPYARVIHDKGGLDAPGAYSFSIDDFYGNFGGPGTNLVIQVGGTSNMPNPEPFDPFTQYHVTVGRGWDHLTVCGRLVNIPQKSEIERGIPLGTPLSFYVGSRTHLPKCEVVVYNFANKFVKYQVKEVSYKLTDTLTGKSQTVKGLNGVAAVRKAGDPVPKDP